MAASDVIPVLDLNTPQDALVAALRLTLLGAGVLALAGLVVTALGAWPTLLGADQRPIGW
jgi:hypothetical protein